MITNKNNKLILFCMVFVTTLFSCQKNIDSVPKEQDYAAKHQQAIESRYGKLNAIIANPTVFYTNSYSGKNEKGEQITSTETAGRPGPLGGFTDYFCGNATCSAGTSASAILSNIRGGIASSSRIVTCDQVAGNVSNVEYTWFVSAPFNITPSGIIGATEAVTTYTDFVGTPHVFTTPIQGNITELPQRPGCPNKYFKITYIVQNVNNDYFTQGYTIQVALNMTTNCSIVPSATIAAFSGAQANTFNAAPCERIDRPLLNPGTGPGNTCTVSGLYSACGLPGSAALVPISAHQLEYRLINNTASNKFADQTTFIGSAINYNTGGTSNTFAPYTSATLYLPQTALPNHFVVRYRNVKTGVCDAALPSTGGNATNWSIYQWTEEVF